jgi:phage replication O-like protein O
MASPQKEKGYTAISNEIFDALARIRIPGECWQVLCVIFRKTYGFYKKEDSISLSQFVNFTGIKRQNVCRAIKKLILMNIVIKKDNGNVSNYCFQKDYELWKPLSKKIILSKKITNVIKNDNQGYSKKRHTKDTITKDKYIYIYSRVVSFLNEKTGSNYKATTRKTISLINARLNEKHVEKDFYTVIENKCADWLYDSKMKKFLRPVTLFGTKFESYLNQVPIKKKADIGEPHKEKYKPPLTLEELGEDFI